MTIYELSEELLSMLEAAEDPDYDIEVLLPMIEDAKEDLADKIENYGKVIKQLEADSEAIKAESKRLAERAKSIENNTKRMKETIQNVMEATGQTKIKTGLFSFNVQKNPASVVMDAEINDLPLEYLVPQDPTINKKMIMEELKAGKELAFAHLEQGQSLRIR